MGLNPVELITRAYHVAEEIQRAYRARNAVWLPKCHALRLKVLPCGTVMYFITPVN